MLKDHAEVHRRVRHLSYEGRGEEDVACITSEEPKVHATQADEVVDEHRSIADTQVDHRKEVIEEVAIADYKQLFLKWRVCLPTGRLDEKGVVKGKDHDEEAVDKGCNTIP